MKLRILFKCISCIALSAFVFVSGYIVSFNSVNAQLNPNCGGGALSDLGLPQCFGKCPAMGASLSVSCRFHYTDWDAPKGENGFCDCEYIYNSPIHPGSTTAVWGSDRDRPRPVK
jgi:hypothetical protein